MGKRFTGKEWDMIKYSLKFLHNRDLSLYYDKETISVLENTMKKLEIDFIPQDEKDKKKIKKYVVSYKGDKREISINKIENPCPSEIFKEKITELLDDKNVFPEALRILMNDNTFNLLSKLFVTMGYTKTFCYIPVLIDNSVDNGEIKIVQ